MAKQTFSVGQVLTADQMTSLQQTAMGGGSATAKTASYVLVAADAGSTVIMNSGSATTITVNTSLFSAGDTVLIINQGAGICTVTAGTATVNTAGSLALGQYESGVLYFLSASAAIFSDYYQASGSSGALALTGSADFTTSSAVNINNCFSATYLNYMFLINITAVSAASPDLTMRMRVGGTDNSSANYNINELANNGATVSGYRDAAGTSFLIGNASTSTAQFLASQGTFLDPFIATPTKLLSHHIVNSSTTNNQKTTGQYHNVSTSYDGFSIIPSTGTISGKVRVYGYTLG